MKNTQWTVARFALNTARLGPTVLVTLLLASCGPSTSSVGSNETLPHLDVGYPSAIDVEDIPSLMAHELLAEQGYTVTPTFYSQAELAVAAVAMGDADFSVGAGRTVWQAVSQGADLITIMEHAANGWMALSIPEISTCRDLDGRRYAHHSEGGVSKAMSDAYILENCPGTQPEILIIPGSANRAAALLGGCSQAEPLPTTCFALYVDEPESMAAEVQRFYQDGFRAFEIKMDNPDLDVARIRTIREAVGEDVILIADANGNWNVKEAIGIIRQLERYNVLVEEPCTGITALEEVRRAVDVPIVADETCHTLTEAAEIIRRRAADLLSIKLMKAGGLLPARKMAAMAESAGLGYRVDGIRGETRVSNTASVHLAKALLHPIAPGLMQHRRLQEDVVTQGGLHFESGRVSVPEEPGLGLECPSFGTLVIRTGETGQSR